METIFFLYFLHLLFYLILDPLTSKTSLNRETINGELQKQNHLLELILPSPQFKNQLLIIKDVLVF
jgi:hypothetical protein